MKNRQIVLVLLAAGVIAAAGLGAYRIGVQRGMAMQAAPALPTNTATASGAENAPGKKTVDGKKVLYWHDPMVPGQKFDKPGKSPFMDMQLVPVYADESAEARAEASATGTGSGQVRIDPAMQQNLGMRTAVVGTSNLGNAVDAVGSISYNDRDVALVQARSSGYVERLYVRAPLDSVRKGQPLAALYVPEWQAAQEEYLSVRRMHTSAPGALPAGLLDAARTRMRLAGMTEDQIRLVDSRGTLQTRMTLTAPIAGVITELSAREGLAVTTGAPLFRINGTGTVWINADVPENAASGIRPGASVEATFPALPGVTVKGKVNVLLPDINAQTRTVKTRIEIANPGNRLLPGMFANIRLSPAAGTARLTVPSEAVIRTGTRNVVMLARDDNSFVPVDVKTGVESNGMTEIIDGLRSGQKVVVSGQFLIDSEASLKSIGAPSPAADPAKPDMPASTPAAPAAPATVPMPNMPNTPATPHIHPGAPK